MQRITEKENKKDEQEKPFLHFCSSTSGSIWEITSQLSTVFSKFFNLTCEFLNEIPEQKETLLLHFIDPNIVKNKEFNNFKKKILIQPIDGTIIKKDVVELMNEFDLIICPAQASSNLIQLNGVTAKTKIIPNYYFSTLFNKNEKKQKIAKYIPKDKFIFYHESTLHPRKGIEILYEGFVKAFSDTPYVNDVVLIVKDNIYNAGTFYKIEKFKRDIIELQSKYKKPANIIKFSSFLDEEELKEFWHHMNCYVTMAKIEGFGIPMLRANLLEIPILCLQNENSGYNDFLMNGLDSQMIPTKQKIAKDEFMWLYDKEKTRWAVPNIDDVISGFRFCFKHHENMKQDFMYIKNVHEEKKKKYLFDNVIKEYVNTINKL
jgi:hypothetical protein